MLKRGISLIFLILFSVFLIISISSNVSAAACAPGTYPCTCKCGNNDGDSCTFDLDCPGGFCTNAYWTPCGYAYCGDKICNYGETCATCAGDCNCPSCSWYCSNTCGGQLFSSACESSPRGVIYTSAECTSFYVGVFYFPAYSSGCWSSGYCVCEHLCSGDSDCPDRTTCSGTILTTEDWWCRPGHSCELLSTTSTSCGTTSCNSALHWTGSCSNYCGSGVCNTCTPTCTCVAGWLNCDGSSLNGCERSTSVTNGVLTSCSAVTCASGYLNCDGNALNGCETSYSLSNCGSCGTVCNLPNAGESCSSSGICQLGTCDSGYGNCDGNPVNGCETYLLNNVNNCGSCGTVCNVANANEACLSGSCTISSCVSGYGNCNGVYSDGCEVYLQTNVNNCGSCGTVCNVANANEACSSGSCYISSCSSNYANCDGTYSNGCEVYLQTNVNNCGSCGTVCNVANANEACSSGSCTISSCVSGYGNCNGVYSDGCEVYLQTNVNNCGSCGTVCNVANANEACSSGSCYISSCSSGYGNCNGVYSDGCETNILTSNSNCGSCGNSCSDGNSCTVDTCNSGSCSNTPYACSMVSDGCCNSPTCNIGNDIDCTTCTQNSQCNDNNACTNNVCSGGTCTYPSITCNDLNSCTSDSCNTLTGCAYSPLTGTSCTSDGNACTNDVCSSGSCIHPAITCNDGNACTVDTCSTSTGCVITPISNCCTSVSQCNDGNACTTDNCISNSCSNTPFLCIHNDGCCPSGCNLGNDNDCTTCTQSSQCDDLKLCTLNLCSGGICNYPTIISCIGGDGCCPTGCNSASDSDCSASCGNGIREGTETCDDGNILNSDGCSSSCVVESGWTCNTATPNVCTLISTQVCGNGIKEGTEGCDDGNLINGDGCSATCTIESGWTCDTATPNVCIPLVTCGNNIQEGTEPCDGSDLNGEDCESLLGDEYTGTLACSGCTFDTSGCSLACDLTSAYWGVTSSVKGDLVRLYVEGTNCNGKTIAFEVREDDFLGSDHIAYPPSIVYGDPSTYGAWTVEWVNDNERYYFIAMVDGTSESITSSKANEDMLQVYENLNIICLSITYCIQYSTESLCESDLCNIGDTNVPSTISCGGTFDAETGCYDYTDCGCNWNNVLGKCGANWESESSCEEGVNISIGECSYTENSQDTCEEDGMLTRSLIASWTWSPENTEYYDPLEKNLKCTNIEDTLTCPALAQVPFFGIYQLAITMTIVGLVYFLFSLKKEKKK